MHIAFVHAIGSELANLKEGCPGVEQPFDTIARQQLPARHMAFAMLLWPAERGLCHLGAQFLCQGTVVRGAGLGCRIVGIIAGR